MVCQHIWCLVEKLTDIACLVIDFSPLTSIIQSPPSVVPDITASLQQLQGKALYSAMDLRYAYLALKIDENSKPLTTFLTPNGAYHWLSIPTGRVAEPPDFWAAPAPAPDQNFGSSGSGSGPAPAPATLVLLWYY